MGILALVLVPAAFAEYPESPADSKREPTLPLRFDPPHQGEISSGFGYRWGRMHNGVDFAGWRFTEVRAPLAGRVVYVGWSQRYWGYGNVVRIRHAGGLETMYAHLASTRVRGGERIRAREVIAEAGCTGSCTGTHLHFETRVGGELVDPMRFLRGGIEVR